MATPSLSEGNLDLKRGYLMWVYITFDFAVQSVNFAKAKRTRLILVISTTYLVLMPYGILL